MSPQLLLQLALLGILLPAVVSGFVFLGLKTLLPERAAAVAIAAGFIAGFFGVSGLGGYAFPPQTVQHWLPHVAVVALALGILEPLWHNNLFARWGVRLVLLELLLWRLFQPFINHPFPSRSWSTPETLTSFAVTTLLIAVFWLALDVLTRRQKAEQRQREAVLPAAITIIAAGSAISVVLAHSLVMGQLSGVVAATLGAVTVVAWLFKGHLGQAATPLITMLLALPWLSLFTTLPLPAVALLSLAPWLLLIPLGNPQPWQRILYKFSLAALPTFVALFLSFQLS